MKRTRSLMLLLIACSLMLCQANAQVSVASPPGKVIHVSHQKTSLLAFTNPIDAVDMGSADLLVRPMQKGSRILKVKAARPGFAPTNLSILTRDGRFYSIDVLYDSLPDVLVHHFEDSAGLGQAVPGFVPPSWSDLERMSRAAAQMSARRFGKFRQFQMIARLDNVLYRDNLLFFVIHIQNESAIAYDIDFVRCYQRDRHRSKRSSSTEKELYPLHQYTSGGQIINGQDCSTIVLVFNKFTIADHKTFAMELYEKDGDRVLNMQLAGKSLLKTVAW